MRSFRTPRFNVPKNLSNVACQNLGRRSAHSPSALLRIQHNSSFALSTSSGNGNRRPILTEIPDTEREIPADLLLLAMGFVGPETATLEEQLGVEIDPRGNVKTDKSYATNIDGVFCAGDANRGQSLVVWAIAEGREAARSIDSFLRRGEAPWLPTRGADAHFGGR